MTGYKLRYSRNTVSLTVPQEIAVVVPDDSRFTCELVDDGILYRLIQAPQEKGLPSWVQLREGAANAA